MRSRSATYETETGRHHSRSRSQPRRIVRTAGEAAALSDIGRRREINQDAFLASERLFAVADGVGGGPGGEVASRLAIEALAAGAEGAFGADDLASLAAASATAVHARGERDAALAGMATTLTAGLFTPEGLAVVHAGDSRLYRLRDGALERLTSDHSFVDQLVDGGIITPEQAATHPLRNMITRALGRDPDVDYDAWTEPVLPGDVFLFCSDGLTKMIDEPTIERIASTAATLDDAVLELVRAANGAGGRDNITVVLAAAPPVPALFA